MLSSALLPLPIVSKGPRECKADLAVPVAQLRADHDQQHLVNRYPSSAHQAAIRQIAAILLGDDHDLSDLAETFKALGDLGYCITAPEWEGLYFKTISGIPQSAAAREAVSRDMWQHMYYEPDLK